VESFRFVFASFILLAAGFGMSSGFAYVTCRTLLSYSCILFGTYLRYLTFNLSFYALGLSYLPFFRNSLGSTLAFPNVYCCTLPKPVKQYNLLEGDELS
jgi:hypothetical protein